MTVIGFTGPAYEARSVEANAQKCINWYPEPSGPAGKAPLILMPSPGLKGFSDVGGSDDVVRGLFQHHNIMYCVVGNTFYEVDSDGVTTSRGTLVSIDQGTRVNIAAIDDEIILVDGVKGYRYIVSTATFNQITDSNFPDTTETITSQDQYFITTEPGTAKFRLSNLNDGSTWDALQFASAEGSPDDLVAAVSDNRQLWLFGDRTTELWTNRGSSPFTFERIPNVFFDWGLAAKNSVAKADNTLIWLAQNRSGNTSIVRAGDTAVQIISTPAIMQAISGYSTISDAFAYGYHHQGHDFYVITFPTEGVTWAYDAATQMWHERSSLINGEYKQHRPNNYTFVYGKHYVGDSQSGTIYELDDDTYTEDGTAIRRVRVTQHTDIENQLLTFRNLVLDVEHGEGVVTGQGSDPQYMLRVSTDGGRTWGNEKWRSPGKIGEYGRRMIWNLLGTGRTFTFELAVSDPIKAVVISANAILEGETPIDG